MQHLDSQVLLIRSNTTRGTVPAKMQWVLIAEDLLKLVFF